MRFVLTALALLAGAALAEDRKDDKKDDRAAFQGTWTIVATKKAEKEPVTAPTVEFKGVLYKIKAGDKVVEEGTFTVDSSRAPKLIDVAATAGMDKGKKWHGIYEISGDTLRAVVGPTDRERPTKYDNPPEGVRSFLLRREKK